MKELIAFIAIMVFSVAETPPALVGMQISEVPSFEECQRDIRQIAETIQERLPPQEYVYVLCVGVPNERRKAQPFPATPSPIPASPS